MNAHIILDILQSIAIVGLCAEAVSLRRRSSFKIDVRGMAQANSLPLRPLPPPPPGSPPPPIKRR